jgi:hypothetical protein
VARIAAAYLWLQSGAALIWWALMLFHPPSRALFFRRDDEAAAFLLPDLVLYIGAASLAAWGLGRGWRWAWPWLLLHVGAAGYAALFCVVQWAMGGPVGLLLMVPAVAVSAWLGWRLRP